MATAPQPKPIDLTMYGSFDFYMSELKMADIQVSGGLVLNDRLDCIRIGTRALQSNTTGTYNIALGANAMSLSTAAIDCTAVGQFAMQQVTGLSAHRNVALGYGAMRYSLNPVDCVVLGTNAALNADDPSNLVVIGLEALGDPALAAGYAGENSVIIGTRAGYKGPGSFNCITGYESGYNVGLAGTNNCLYGFQCGYNIQDAEHMVCVGYKAGYQENRAAVGVGDDNSVYVGYMCGFQTNEQCSRNVAIGCNCLDSTTGAIYDVVAIGNNCGSAIWTVGINVPSYSVLIGSGCCYQTGVCPVESVAVGFNCMYGNPGGGVFKRCVGIGSRALEHSSNVTDVVAIGTYACESSLGSKNVIGVGNYAARNSDTLCENATCIGTYAGENMQNSKNMVCIGNDAGRYTNAPQFSVMEDSVLIGDSVGALFDATSTTNVVVGTNCCSESGVGAQVTKNVIIGSNSAVDIAAHGALLPKLNVILGSDCCRQNVCTQRSVVIGSEIIFEIPQDPPVVPPIVDVAGCILLGSVSVGRANLANCVCIGSGVFQDKTTDSINVVAIGTSSCNGNFAADRSVAIGAFASCNGLDSLAIGYQAVAWGPNEARIGTSGYYTTAWIGCAGGWTSDSDLRLKTDINALQPADAADYIARLQPVTFRIKAAPDGITRAGFIAQQVQSIPAPRFDPVAVTPETGSLGLEYNQLLAVAVGAIQDLQKRNRELELVVADLIKKLV